MPCTLKFPEKGTKMATAKAHTHTKTTLTLKLSHKEAKVLRHLLGKENDPVTFAMYDAITNAIGVEG